MDTAPMVPEVTNPHLSIRSDPTFSSVEASRISVMMCILGIFALLSQNYTPLPEAVPVPIMEINIPSANW
jgi:hypothetical protein